MKKNRLLNLLPLTGIALLGAATLASAQNTNPTNTFDVTASAASFVNWWGMASPTWDGKLDAGSDPASGSVLYNVPFVGAAGEQFMTFFTISGRWGWDGGYVLDATTYTNLSFDIRVDPSSGQRVANNDYGPLEIGLVTDPGWGTTYLPTRTIPLSAKGAWVHFDYPLNPAMANIDRVVGFFIKMWSNGGHTNSLIFNIDNFMITKPTAPVIIPPPTLTLPKATPGVNFIAASAGQYDRQEIRTVGTNYSWVGASGPVSYSMNVAQVADNAHPGFLHFMHLIPGVANPTRPDSDWHETNVVMWRINNNANGSGWSDIVYKTNAPDDNGHLYDTGGLGGVGSGSPVGTWTLTFNQNTNVTITAPGGETHTTNLPPEVIEVFKTTPNMQVNVGCVPGELSRIGQKSVVSGVKITGTPGEPNLDSNFVGQPMDTNTWGIVASSSVGVQQLPTDARFWLNWTLPDKNFSPESSDKAAGGTWTGLTPGGFVVGSVHYALLRQADLPGANDGFFRMIKRVPVKLQVLLPGETNAPGTVTGKIGTPTPQPLYGIFNVTINMVDSTWHVLTSTDTVTMSSSDPGFQPTFGSFTVALVNGTATMEVYLGTVGAQTITATDTTDPTKTANTSSPVTVNP